MKKVLIVGHCDIDHPQITSLIEDNFSARVTRARLFRGAVCLLGENIYDLVIINRIGAFDQESGIAFIEDAVRGGRLKTPLMMVTNYKDQMDSAVSSGAVPGYGKDRLYDKETMDLLGKYLS